MSQYIFSQQKKGIIKFLIFAIEGDDGYTTNFNWQFNLIEKKDCVTRR